MRTRKISKTAIAQNEFGEYHVRAYDQHGQRFEDADYFTDCRDDAKATAKAMINTEYGQAKSLLWVPIVPSSEGGA